MERKQNREKIRQAIAGRRFSDKMKRGLELVLEGWPYREAASEAGVDHRDLHRNAKTVHGLCRAHLEAWPRFWRDCGLGDFPAVWRHHLRRGERDAA